jgi:ribonuclease HI
LALYIKHHARFNLEIIKVKSHAGNQYNEMVDALAVKRRKELEEV